MRLNTDGTRHRHAMDAGDYVFVPTPPAQLMAETVTEFLVRLRGVGRKFAEAHTDSNLVQVMWELERLKLFCEEKGTPTHDANN